ncbi:hypothetical protein [Candidatus Leptofilum sp.]|uniref:hypothetical protein n=1 Tax=Candidatus Leptofilum sp. TaxID=3241576 RepID=UPI003B5B3488
MASLIRIAWFLDESGESDMIAQLELSRQLLPSHRQNAAKQLILEQGRIIFFRAQVYILLKYLILYGNDEDNDVESKELQSIGSCLLSVTELISSQVKERKSIQRNETQSLNALTHEIVTNSFILGKFSIPAVRLLMVRARYMFKTIHLRLKNNSKAEIDFLDIDHFFQESVGIQLTEYLNFGTSLIVYFLQFLQKDSALQEKGFPYIYPQKLFEKSNVHREKVNIFFDLLSITLSQAKTDLQASIALEHRREFIYDFLFMKSKPLVQFSSDFLIPFSIPFLFERITSGIFWQLLDHLNQNYDRTISDQFTRYHGRIFQEYVEEFIQEIHKQHPVEGERIVQEQTYRIGKQEGKTSDIMIFGSDYAIFVEASATRMQAKGTISQGTRTAFDSDFKKMILHNAKSLDNFIKKFRSGSITIEGIESEKIAVYYPVIITMETFAGQNSIIHPFLKSTLESDKLFANKDIAGLSVLEIDDIEYLEGYINATLISILKSWHGQSNDLLPKDHFKDHLKNFPEKDELSKTLLLKITGAALDEATQFMFNKSS